jgi:hypothetical protein
MYSDFLEVGCLDADAKAEASHQWFDCFDKADFVAKED